MLPTNELLTKRNEFENSCSGNLKALFSTLDNALCNPNYKLQKARDLHLIYANALKIGQLISGYPKKMQDFIEILQIGNGKFISRLQAPKICLDFNPIIHAISNKKQIPFDLEVVNPKNIDALIEASVALDQLSLEGVGKSFGIDVYKRMIQSDSSLCILAKNENGEPIGCLFGTLVELSEPSLKVFHFWICARKANHPGICLVENFSKLLNAKSDLLKIDFNADYLSLTVDVDNENARELYYNAGFIFHETSYSDYSKKDVDFMIMELTNEEKPQPSMAAVTEAVTQKNLQTLGYWMVISSQIKFKAINFFNGLRYS